MNHETRSQILDRVQEMIVHRGEIIETAFQRFDEETLGMNPEDRLRKITEEGVLYTEESRQIDDIDRKIENLYEILEDFTEPGVEEPAQVEGVLY